MQLGVIVPQGVMGLLQASAIADEPLESVAADALAADAPAPDALAADIPLTR